MMPEGAGFRAAPDAAKVGEASRATNEQLRATAAALDKMTAKAGPAANSLRGLADAAEKVKTALQQLEISESTVRKAMEMAGLSADIQRNALIALGVKAIDAGPLLEGLGVTVDKLDAAFRRSGLSAEAAAAAISRIEENIAARKAEAEAEKAAAKAKQELADAEEALRKQEEAMAKARKAAMEAVTGRATRDILGTRGAPTSAGGAADLLGEAAEGLEAMARAQMDLTLPLSIIDKMLADLSGRFAMLSGADLGSAGAVMDAMRALFGQLMSGEIQIAEFQDGVRALQPELARLAGEFDKVGEAQKKFWDEFAKSELERQNQVLREARDTRIEIYQSETELWLHNLREQTRKGREIWQKYYDDQMSEGRRKAATIASLTPAGLAAWLEAERAKAEVALGPRVSNTSGPQTPPAVVNVKLIVDGAQLGGATTRPLVERALSLYRVTS